MYNITLPDTMAIGYADSHYALWTGKPGNSYKPHYQLAEDV